MRYLKTYESFEVVWNQISVNKFISDCGLVMEDIEDIFLEYSDLGYLISIMPNKEGGTVSGIIVDVTGDFSERRIDPFGPETNRMINQVKNNTERLGLKLDHYPERLNDVQRNGIWKLTMRFYLSNDNI
jgi:hypothetical protein